MRNRILLVLVSWVSAAGGPLVACLSHREDIAGKGHRDARGPVRTGLWRAGAAKVKVTPRESIWLGGYGARTKPSEGVLSDLHASALALEDETGKIAVIVSADTLGFTRPMAEEIAARCRRHYGLERDRLLLNASHTHS